MCQTKCSSDGGKEFPFLHIEPRCLSSWFDWSLSLEGSPGGSAEEPGLLVEAGVPPLGEVDALEHARLAGHAGVDVVVGQDHGVRLECMI